MRTPHSDWHNCRPAFIELDDNGKGYVLPDDHPTMKKVMAVWETFTPAQRYTYHKVMCLNSKDPVDLVIVRGLLDQLTKA